MSFTHLHVHTKYSILDGATVISPMIEKCRANGMNAIAVTDHGAMFGIFSFLKEVSKVNAANPDNPFKAIVGCEVYVAENGLSVKQSRENIGGRHLILLAKNLNGYHNLSKMVSIGYIDGFYGKPRIDHEILEQYHEDVIACSACLGGELPKAIMKYNTEIEDPEKMNLDTAEKIIEFYHNLFGEDYYIELQRNGHQEQDLVNSALVYLADKHRIKYIATNDVHFLNKEDYEAHKILICLNTGKEYSSKELGEEDDKGMAYSGEEYLKTSEEMEAIFADLPLAIENTREIVDKVESYSIESKVSLPDFEIPKEFENQDAYLRYLTYEGAKERYPEMTDDIKERIDFELSTVQKMGFPGYFLIVNDFTKQARKMGVLVGPGRGSAAGSVVAYCLGITQVDPIKYDLLFERFLNPDRISMPDMDIDFDDEGREKVIQYVIEKYGKEKVAQIVTFGSMAAKMAIKDCARVLKLDLKESTRLAKLVPDGPKVNLQKAFNEVSELKNELESQDSKVKLTLKFAQELEGSIRSTGVHACGVIIAKNPIIDTIPLSIAKGNEMPVTQYEGSQVEDAGLLKMDFLGLKTLTIIKETLYNIKQRHGIDFDIDHIPLDDKLTYDLFSRGDTVAVFQFESPGMRKYLQSLMPERFEDVIAMVSLYRPGPMDKIPSFIKRKRGEEKIEYPFPEMEKYLKDTYGITVYQEQVMLLSQSLANFTKGEADTLRKAMGKKKIDQLNKMEDKFFAGAKENHHELAKCKIIWEEWKKFAEYAFNKSHATCYAYVAYQTAYLKAHYPAEFMAANLTNNIKDLSEITTLLDECKRMGISVLGPDVNESWSHFTVNLKNEIRFGLSGLKNVGENAVDNIIEQRNQNGLYKTAFEFLNRVDLRLCNKRSIESLVKSGAFDCFTEVHRAQFFYSDNKDNTTFLDKLIRNITQSKQNSQNNQSSLFEMVPEESQVAYLPEFPDCSTWHQFYQLKQEKEVAGFYISGHPLDDYKLIQQRFCNCTLENLKNQDFLSKKNNMVLSFCAMITSIQRSKTQKGTDFMKVSFEDYNNSYEMMFFGRKYKEFNSKIYEDDLLYVRVVVAEKWQSKDAQEQYEVRIQDIIPLEDSYVSLLRKITLSLSIRDANSDLASYLLEKIKNSKTLKNKESGIKSKEIPLKINIIDADHKISLLFKSSNLNVDAQLFFKDLTLQVPYQIDLN